ncbi:hypothetical protein [Fulvimarina manganoxydans]|nr:hypothetical protein [Fulvimarina manganoxydans]
MARRTENIVEIDEDSVEAAAAAYEALGEKVFGQALQGALNDTAIDAQRQTGRRFKTAIEGGPSRFTEINPGSKRSSVFARDRKFRAGREPEAATAVQRLQSSYLKYMLDESDGVREPGDVGFAETYNYIPTEDGMRRLGLSLTPQGTFKRRDLKRLFKQARTEKRRREEYEKAGKTTEQADTLEKRLKTRRRNERDKTGYDGLFFGKPNGRSSEKTGFWLRLARREGQEKGGLKLVVWAAEKSRYPSLYLTPHWNDGHTHAASYLPMRVRTRIFRAVRMVERASGANVSDIGAMRTAARRAARAAARSGS